MIKSFPTSTPAGFTMPVSWADAVHAAAVRTFPTVGGVSVIAAAAGAKRRRTTGVAQVCVNPITTDVRVLDGAFPGTSVWSPPI